ncbi:MAG: hypothetical protein AAF206_23795 [Bacteroidota bacterium]
MKEQQTQVVEQEINLRMRNDLELIGSVYSDASTITRSIEEKEDTIEFLTQEHARTETQLKAQMMHDFLDVADSLDAFIEAVNNEKEKAEERYRENLTEIFKTTKPIERNLRQLQLLYQNGGTDPEVYIFPVNEQQFVGAANPKHFNAMKEWLQKNFYAFDITTSPFYITYLGVIKNASAAEELAQLAEETKALAILNIPKRNTVEKVLEFARRDFKITGIPSHLGHLVLPATWAYASGAFEDLDEERKMAVSLAGAFTGKLLKAYPGEFISSMESEAILGVDGIVMDYDKETLDSVKLKEAGLVPVINGGYIEGANTPNTSNNPDLCSYPTVDIANSIEKDLIKFTNKKANGKWGKRQEEDLKLELIEYFNGLIRREMLQDPCPDPIITYDEKEEEVSIDLEVQYFGTVSKFPISLKGKRDKIELQKG